MRTGDDGLLEAAVRRRKRGIKFRWGDVKSEEWGGAEEDRPMWGRRPSEEWPSVVSAVLRWRLSALTARPPSFELEQREIVVSVCIRWGERKGHRELP